MKLVLGQDDAVAAWVARKIGFDDPDFFGPCKAIAVADANDVPLAGVVFSDFREWNRSCSVSIAAESPRWATRGVIHALLSYPFDQLGCQRVTTFCRLSNARALKLCKGLGFVREGVARYGFGDEHAVVMSMLRKEFDRMFRRKPK